MIFYYFSVLIFNCDTNPCKAVEMWIPETTDEEVLKIVQLTLVSLNLDFRCFIVKVFGLVYGV